jgi:hypothetical protein
MDSEYVMRAAQPFLGEVFGTHTNWKPSGAHSLQTVDFLRPE